MPIERVFDRLDRPEVVTTLRIGQEAPVALEVGIEPRRLTSAGVDVGASLIDLPDLDNRVADRLPGRRGDPSRQMRDLADARRDGVVEDQQVVIGIERQLVRIKRPLGRHGRRAGELLGKHPRHRKGCHSGGGEGANELTAMGRHGGILTGLRAQGSEPRAGQGIRGQGPAIGPPSPLRGRIPSPESRVPDPEPHGMS